MARSSNPLVLRPGYGESHTSEAKLPEGDPGGKGVTMAPELRGQATFSKPEGDIRIEDIENAPIYRRESPDALLKHREQVDTREENDDASISFNGLGESDTSKTKYPYRDGVPNTNSSTGEIVVEMWKLVHAHETPVSYSTRMAARIVDVMNGLNPKVVQRGSGCSTQLKRADIKNLRWLFVVDCGNGPKLVKMKAVRKNNVVKFALMDLTMTCSCPAWRWLGSEHHAVGDEYIDGKPRGTASVPVIKDPLMHNRVCKHVAAVMGLVKKWEIPKKKG